ncbi:MAG: head-tail adaptor protein [Alphaproteobacteria bacterium]|nr:MAG: head-tail adaptor protein [Alphaproteobacteria bacterium]
MSAPAAGALRHRLVLEQAVRVDDGGGGASESWQAVATLWAALRPLPGAETVEAGRLSGRRRIEVTMRYRSGVSPAMRFRLGARIFHILSVANTEERNVWLVAECEERDL